MIIATARFLAVKAVAVRFLTLRQPDVADTAMPTMTVDVIRYAAWTLEVNENDTASPMDTVEVRMKASDLDTLTTVPIATDDAR